MDNQVFPDIYSNIKIEIQTEKRNLKRKKSAKAEEILKFKTL